MPISAFYLLLCAVGTIVPYVPFAAWLAHHPIDAHLPGRFFGELLSTRIGTFFGLDVVLSAAVLFTFMIVEKRRGSGARTWTAVLGTLLVGVSLGLPLYLYERERSLARAT